MTFVFVPVWELYRAGSALVSVGGAGYATMSPNLWGSGHRRGVLTGPYATGGF